MFWKKYKRIDELTDKLVYALERINLCDYVEYLQHPNRIIFYNFLTGVARGFGYAIGFSLLGAIVIYIVIEAGWINMPLINEYLKKLMEVLG